MTIGVTLISGLWPTEDECGLKPLADKIRQLPGNPVTKICHWQDSVIPWTDVLIGHSLGGERCVKLAKEDQMNVKYMALIDPVAGGWFPVWFWVPGMNFKISDNVRQADCFTRKSWGIPPSSKILNLGDRGNNFPIDTDHANAPRNEYAVSMILSRIRDLSVNNA